MREFDDIIRGKLEQLPVEGTPDWTALQSRLEGNEFDSLLRDQLSSTTSPGGADKVAVAAFGWEALSGKLDLASETEGEVFDRILSQKLTSAETALEPQASWKVLSHRMDTLWPLRKVLVRYRVIEMAAAIALLLTFAPILRDNPIVTKGGASTASTTESLQALPQKSTLLSSPATNLFLQPEEIAELVYASNSGVPQHSSVTNASMDAQAFQPTAEVTGTNSPVYSPFALLKGVYNWFAKPSRRSTTMLAAQQHAQGQQRSAFDGKAVTSAASTLLVFPSDKEANLDLQSLDQLMLSPLAIAQSKVPLHKLPGVKASKWEVGAQGGLKVWNISTPVDMEFEQQASNRWRGGVSLGVGANRSLGKRTALGLGVSLTPLNYDPNLPTVLDAADINSTFSFSRAESFDGISVNIAQVPVDFRVRLTKPEKRTSIWAFAGLAANFTLSSRYDLQQDYGVTSLNVPVSGPGGGSELEEVIEVERSFSEAKDFTPGVLEIGGKLAGNAFFTGRLGLEASHKLNDKLSVFSSLSYSQYLPIASGFGPNNDRLSSAGLSLGARISL
ncbi:MAG: hypothetical protein AB8F78_11785 [Saprospiraceae bacterium]